MTDSAFALTNIIGIIALIIASISDIKTREVPDWLNFSIIAFAVGNAIIISTVYGNSSVIIKTLLGLAIGVAIGMIMFYTGQWGGGDSKLIMGLSALLGFSMNGSGLALILDNSLITFFLNTLFVGALYGVAYSLMMAFINFKDCKEEADKKLKTNEALIARIALLVILILAFTYAMVENSPESIFIFVFALLLFILFYVWVLVSTVEKVCMVKKVTTKLLTEGDWVVNPVFKGKKLILNPTKIGLTKEDIALLNKNSIRSVTIKTGIPFVPSFLIAYLITLFLGNWLVYLI